MNTLKELYEKSDKIVSSYFDEVINISTTALITKHTNNALHIGISYFVKEDGKNIFGNITGKNFDEAIEKLSAQCVLHKINNVPEGVINDIII